MGSETNASSESSSSLPVCSPSPITSSPSGKRSRDPEDEVYVDNLRCHKRYLTEIMATSLNGLSVGEEPLPENILDSPARSETSMFYLRDELSCQYSPMSEDLDDCRYCETCTNASPSQPESPNRPSSPVSPYRCQKFPSIFSSGPSAATYPLHGSATPGVPSSQPRQRGSDSEGRFPSSPSDICHSADLRRAALLRSVQMRTQPLGPSQFEVPFNPMQDSTLSKSLVDERDYQIEEECSSMSISMPEDCERPCRVLNMNLKEDLTKDEVSSE